MRSRTQYAGCLALMLSICVSAMASGLQDGDASPAVPGLPAQELAAGECGAFFWDRADPNPLRLFENQSRGTARLWQDGEILELGTAPRGESHATGQRILRTYRLPSDEIISVEGEITATRDGEAVIGRAVLRRTLPGGAMEVSPLMGLISCRDADDR
ncbi:hypothetical protein [Hyphobacterium sp.]|uniref:hypothetical protein n=1 Tax=Hyphobacterium sp. TaxID=2004662 RepID=UPI003749C16B